MKDKLKDLIQDERYIVPPFESIVSIGTIRDHADRFSIRTITIEAYPHGYTSLCVELPLIASETSIQDSLYCIEELIEFTFRDIKLTPSIAEEATFSREEKELSDLWDRAWKQIKEVAETKERTKKLIETILEDTNDLETNINIEPRISYHSLILPEDFCSYNFCKKQMVETNIIE